MTPKVVISQARHPKPPNLMPIYHQPRKQLTPSESKKTRKTIIWLVLLVSFLVFGIIQDITGGKGFGSDSTSQRSSVSTTPEPLGSEAQKGLDAANAMDEQNSHDARLNNQPPPPKIGIACGPPAKTNPDGTISVSARRLYYDYVTDSSAASDKYQLHTLKIVGTILEVQPDATAWGGGDVHWLSLVSGNTWIDNDSRRKGCIGCYFSDPTSKAVLRRIEAIYDKEGTTVQIVVSLTCNCKCDVPTDEDPQLELDCSSVKIKCITYAKPA